MNSQPLLPSLAEVTERRAQAAIAAIWWSATPEAAANRRKRRAEERRRRGAQTWAHDLHTVLTDADKSTL